MGTTIKLDTNAMNTLFPEGSEARVELQGAVIASFAKKAFPKFLNEDLKKQVLSVVNDSVSNADRDEIRAGIKDALAEYLYTRFDLRLLEDGKRKIRNEVKNSASSALRGEIQDQLHEELKGLRAEMSEKIAEYAPVYLQSMKGEAFDKLVKAEALRMVERAYKGD